MPVARQREHRYEVEVLWTGNTGSGTQTYTGYERSHEVRCAGKPVLLGSSDPAFRGDASRWNPEELLLTALSACHMLSYLHLCASAGIVVTEYVDRAEGVMEESGSGGRFTGVILRPLVTVQSQDDVQQALHLHEPAHKNCFIANSVNFPLECKPSVRV